MRPKMRYRIENLPGFLSVFVSVILTGRSDGRPAEARARLFIHVLTLVLAATSVFLCGATPCVAQSSAGPWSAGPSSVEQPENAEISSRRAAERTVFSDQEITDGFFKTALGAQSRFGQNDQRIRKFDEPVLVLLSSTAPHKIGRAARRCRR